MVDKHGASRPAETTTARNTTSIHPFPRKAMKTILLSLLVMLAFGRDALARQAAPAPSEGTSALTFGYLNIDFGYTSPDRDARFTYGKRTPALILTSETATITIAYGTQTGDERFGTPDVRMFAASVLTGDNAYLFKNVGGFPLGVFVPFRLQMGYRNVSKILETEDPDVPKSLNLANLGLGAGGGALLRLKPGNRFVSKNVVLFGSLIWTVGGTGDINGDLKRIGLTRTAELNLEVKLEHFLGSGLGLTLGYTLRKQRWTFDKLDSIGDALDRITTPEKLRQVSRQHLVRLGINW